MKHATILVPSGQNNVSSIVGAFKILNKANDFQERSGKQKVFKVQLASEEEKIEMYDGLFTLKPHLRVAEITHTDLVIIPALHYNFKELLDKNKDLVSWVKSRHLEGAEVASICTGAFLLAATGLLDGRGCSTHWNAAKAFREMFPNVNLLPDKLITDENGIYTNGGAFSFLNLMLYLVEKYYDRETAIYCSKIFQIDINRSSQSEFTIFTGQKDHEDEVVKKAQHYLESSFSEKIKIEALAEQFAVSRRNFDRRFIKATGNSPIEYLQRVKIEAAKKMFETTQLTVNEVMYETGYSDPKAFREVFRRITGLLPLQYKGKYNKEEVNY